MLHELGRLNEAEAILGEGLPLEEDSHLRALVYDTIALAVMDHARFREQSRFLKMPAGRGRTGDRAIAVGQRFGCVKRRVCGGARAHPPGG